MYRQIQSCTERISYRAQEQLQGHRRSVLVTLQRILPAAGATASGTISYVWERQPVSQNPATDPWTRTSVTSVGYSFQVQSQNRLDSDELP